MASQFFSDTTSRILVKSLDAAAARQKAIANNIANVETPGYKRCYVSFESELKRILAMKDGHSKRKAIDELAPVRMTDIYSPARPDGNNVNIDAEIADLAKTTLKYKACTVLMQIKGSMLRSAVNGGR